MKKIFLLPLFFVLAHGAQTQTFGGHPPGLNWQQINTDNVRVIFPAGMEAPAQRTAGIINFIHEHNLRSVGNQTEKIDLVIQNQTVIPNGFVTLAPYHSEFFATPPQDPALLGSLEWMDVLAIHEYRHALQFTNAERGFTALLRGLFGEQGWAGGAFFSIPGWYWEGDAVLAETALTDAGRGRLPAFSLEQRAVLLNDRRYSYMKARNGSWKDLLPNHYQLGYALNKYGREQFGNDVWKEVFHDAAAYRKIIYPFSGALKRHTGIRTPKLYRQTYDSLAIAWKSEQERLSLTDFTLVNQDEKRQVTSYNFPRPLSDGNIVCVKEGYDKIARLVAIDPKGKEHCITTQGIVIDNYISVKNDKIAWSELGTHLRWGNVYYSSIVTYDYNTGEKNCLTADTKYFSPAFSHSGDKIAAVYISENQQNEIHVLDARSGEVIVRLPNPDNHFIMYPQWTEDDLALVFVDKTGGRMALVRQDIAEGTKTPLTAYSAHVINTPYVSGNQVYFSASFSGIDNIYAISMGEQGVRQMTSVPLGAYQPAVSKDGNTLYFSNFSVTGYDLARMPVVPSNWRSIVIKEPVEMYPVTAFEAEGGNILDEIKDENYAVENYRPALGGLRLHSWTYVSEGPGSVAIVGLMNNVLNTTAVTLGLGYNTNERQPELTGTFQYGGYFPVVKLEGGYSRRQADYLQTDRIERLNFDEGRFGAGFSIPLQHYHGAYFTGLELSAMAFYRTVSDYKRDTLPVFRDELNFAHADLGLSFYNLRKTAPQHIHPRFGQVLRAGYQQAFERSDIQRFWLQSRLYLPGLLPNHNLVLEGDYQEEALTNAYQFGDLFEYARGYAVPVNDSVWRLGANYHFPIVYPDWGFGGLLYFRRFRGNIFYDESRFRLLGGTFDQRSTGGEFIMDTQWFNLPVVLSLGLRYSRLLETDFRDPDRKGRFEFFLVTDL